ncbi:MAG: SDR family NAD(P)-dependent oxidoreductase [Pseudomonadota bacterium]
MFRANLLKDRHALVTGASSGIGRHLAATLARHGARVTLAARRVDRIEAAAAEIAAAGGEAGATAMDVADRGAIEAAFDAAEDARGPLSIVVANAGVAIGERAEEISEEAWDGLIDVNLKGVWLTNQAAGRRMMAHRAGGRIGGGAIVNTGSILGERVAPGVAPYAVSKAGVHQMTKALAIEWARHGIRVNALAPGWFQTDINMDFFETEAGAATIKRIPMRRSGALPELEGALLLLTSDAGAYITGAVLPVDGGHLCSTL